MQYRLFYYGRPRTAHVIRKGTGCPAPLYSRRLSIPQPCRRDNLCRQGQESEEARFVLLHGVARTRSENPDDGTADSRPAAHRRSHGTGCAAARKLAYQDPAAALQHDAQGRQDLSLDSGAQRALPPCDVHPEAGAGRFAVFRSLLFGDGAEKHARPHSRHLPAPHLFPEPLARSDSPGQIRRMPGVPHRQLQGAVRRPAERRGLRRRHRTDKEDAAGRPALHTRVPAPADDGGRGGAELRGGGTLQKPPDAAGEL